MRPLNQRPVYSEDILDMAQQMREHRYWWMHDSALVYLVQVDEVTEVYDTVSSPELGFKGAGFTRHGPLEYEIIGGEQVDFCVSWYLDLVPATSEEFQAAVAAQRIPDDLQVAFDALLAEWEVRNEALREAALVPMPPDPELRMDRYLAANITTIRVLKRLWWDARAIDRNGKVIGYIVDNHQKFNFPDTRLRDVWEGGMACLELYSTEDRHRPEVIRFNLSRVDWIGATPEEAWFKFLKLHNVWDE